MPGTIRAWLRKKRLGFGHSRTGPGGIQLEPPLPFAHRNPNPDSLQGPGLEQNGGFFRVLPPEIRRKILIEAFGGRTLHIYLGLQYPRLPDRHSGSESQARHGGSSVPLHEYMDTPRRKDRDTSKPLVWKWWSCVCHRGDPESEWLPPQHYDNCLHGRADGCELWPGQAPEKCQVGAIGWLRAGHQAHSEGLEVLYSTNTISLNGGRLLNTILHQHEDPSLYLIPQTCLDLVMSLEIQWKFVIFSMQPDEQAAARCAMREYLGLIPKAFPNLHKLHISFEDEMYDKITPPDEDEVHAAVGDPMGDMMKQLSNLGEFTVGLPTNVFQPFNHRGYREERNVTPLKTWLPVLRDGEDLSGDTGRGVWIVSGVESDVYFDYQGKRHRSSQRAHVLL